MSPYRFSGSSVRSLLINWESCRSGWENVKRWKLYLHDTLQLLHVQPLCFNQLSHDVSAEKERKKIEVLTCPVWSDGGTNPLMDHWLAFNVSEVLFGHASLCGCALTGYWQHENSNNGFLSLCTLRTLRSDFIRVCLPLGKCGTSTRWKLFFFISWCLLYIANCIIRT